MNPGSPRKTSTHVFSNSGKYMTGFLVKSFGDVAGVRCWRVPLADRPVTAFLLRRLCPCRRSEITTVHCWCWTPTMVCAVLRELYCSVVAKRELSKSTKLSVLVSVVYSFDSILSVVTWDSWSQVRIGLCSDPHLWSWILGESWKNIIKRINDRDRTFAKSSRCDTLRQRAQVWNR